MTADKTKVFVVHGRDQRARDALFAFLRGLGLQPMEWSEAVASARHPTPDVLSVIESAFAIAQAVVVLFTADDVATLRSELSGENDPPQDRELTPQVRQNVLFEAGRALATHRDRTVICQIGIVRPPSDIAGLAILHLDNSPATSRELASRLERAGCQLKMTETDGGPTLTNIVAYPFVADAQFVKTGKLDAVLSASKKTNRRLKATLCALAVMVGVAAISGAIIWQTLMALREEAAVLRADLADATLPRELMRQASTAADQGDLSSLEIVFKRFPKAIDGDLDIRPLFAAVSTCSYGTVFWLLDHGANPNVLKSCSDREDGRYRGWSAVTLGQKRVDEGIVDCGPVVDVLKRYGGLGRATCPASQ